MSKSLKLAAMLVAVTAASASAQTTGRNSNGVPPGQRPRDGMCRVWVTGVPAGRQAAATDCATAEAQARLTANSRVIYGGFPGKKGSSDDGLYTRRRQLADGSWVIDRYRRDANGNITVVSTRAVGSRDMDKKHRKHKAKEWKKEKGDDNEMNDDRKVAHEQLKDHQKMEKEQFKEQYGGKGKGKNK
ncbi:MAG: hypothetical protein H0W63_06665 [Gemmatimonadaceae bacterium]|nr:hypothetical protein [Gemmatimonadaceae bacterium]